MYMLLVKYEAMRRAFTNN